MNTPLIPAEPVQHILMIKSHSAGVGDVLRSSAAWRRIKNEWPTAQLHLLFLSKHPGYASEQLIGAHSLLQSCTFLPLVESTPGSGVERRVAFARVLAQALALAKAHRIDWVIDFEMHGLRTALLTRALVRALRQETPKRVVQSVGVGQFALRSLFYDRASVSMKAFAKARHKAMPMDYCERDFVALSALGLEREGTAIELTVQESDRAKAKRLLDPLLQARHPMGPSDGGILGLNIGCGTPDALYKRPDLSALASALVLFLMHRSMQVVLTGAPFEQEVNAQFLFHFDEAWRTHAANRVKPVIMDLAGKTDMLVLSAVIECCDLFVSTDSGPYHMAVALRIPTLCWFVVDEPTSIHQESWCAHLLNPTAHAFQEALLKLCDAPRA